MSDMAYEVTREYHNHEFEFSLYPGDVLYDVNLEPDLIAQLLSNGILVLEGDPYEPEGPFDIEEENE